MFLEEITDNDDDDTIKNSIFQLNDFDGTYSLFMKASGQYFTPWPGTVVQGYDKRRYTYSSLNKTVVYG